VVIFFSVLLDLLQTAYCKLHIPCPHGPNTLLPAFNFSLILTPSEPNIQDCSRVKTSVTENN